MGYSQSWIKFGWYIDPMQHLANGDVFSLMTAVCESENVDENFTLEIKLDCTRKYLTEIEKNLKPDFEHCAWLFQKYPLLWLPHVGILAGDNASTRYIAAYLLRHSTNFKVTSSRWIPMFSLKHTPLKKPNSASRKKNQEQP